MEISRINKDSIKIVKDYFPDDIYNIASNNNVAVLIAGEDENVYAAMMVREDNNTAEIVYVTVADEHRECGICSMLIHYYLWSCAENNISSVKCLVSNEEGERYVKRVLIRLGFLPDKNRNCIITTTVDEFISYNLPEVPAKGHLTLPFEALDKEELKFVAKNIMAESPFTYSADSFGEFSQRLSFAVFMEDRIRAVALVKELEDTLELSCMYVSKEDLQGSVLLLNALQEKVRTITEYSGAKVIIPIINNAAEKLAKHVLPNCDTNYYVCLKYKLL